MRNTRTAFWTAPACQPSPDTQKHTDVGLLILSQVEPKDLIHVDSECFCALQYHILMLISSSRLQEEP